MNVFTICLLLTGLLLAPAPLWARVIRPATATIDSCPLPAVLFPLGSAEPEFGQAEKLLTGLRHCQISPTTPLSVIGHTCVLGTEVANMRLSRRRAGQVATLLRDRGYTVATVSGKGATEPVSTNPTKRYLNRRVTLAPVDQSPAWPAAITNHDGA